MFYSEDLGSAWEIAVRGGRLILRRPGADDRPLTPSVPDVFLDLVWWPSAFSVGVQFVRDAAGRVTGFTFSALRHYETVRNVRFDRMTLR